MDRTYMTGNDTQISLSESTLLRNETFNENRISIKNSPSCRLCEAMKRHIRIREQRDRVAVVTKEMNKIKDYKLFNLITEKLKCRLSDQAGIGTFIKNNYLAVTQRAHAIQELLHTNKSFSIDPKYSTVKEDILKSSSEILELLYFLEQNSRVLEDFDDTKHKIVKKP
ncbi:hypothetical protein RF11_02318 [Thelohanellus kitauei]|uniref:Uncharacterized protein n=1 Tax=Thelohanellus kitauei TaxID=669202 RepID=A0A0C2IXD5_THEKT|nr:hypothetical protein RF11_02318 [Thelohanellus kitauei]